MKYRIVLFLLCTLHLSAAETYSKSDKTVPIKRLQIFSERCSGSNFIAALLLQNFHFENFHYTDEESFIDDVHTKYAKSLYTRQLFRFNGFDDCTLHILLTYPYGHKHFSPWLTLPLNRFHGPEEFYTFSNSDDCLFIVVFRNAYDWIRSFYNTPWHTAPELQKLPFEFFIRSSWIVDYDNKEIAKFAPTHPLIDLNPETGECFENLFQLRSAKIHNLLMIRDRVKNIYYVNYETVAADPERFVTTIYEAFNIEKSKETHLTPYYKGDKAQGIFHKKKYRKLTDSDIAFINSQLDLELEERIGYTLIDK